MFYVVVESEKLKKIALTRRMLVSFGAVSTDMTFDGGVEIVGTVGWERVRVFSAGK